MRYISMFVLVLVFFLVFYVLLPLNYSVINYTEVLWYKDVNNAVKSDMNLSYTNFPTFKTGHYYFRNNIFFYDSTGDILHKIRLEGGNLATISRENYITYHKIGDQISMYSAKGFKLWTMDTFSYPFLSPSGNRFILLSTDNTSVAFYDRYRKEIMPFRFISTMITDFNYCPFNDNLVLGTSEGKFKVIDYKGEDVMEARVTGSEHDYIKSVAASDMGKYYGCVAGINPEHIMVFNRDGKMLWKKKTEYNRRRRVSIFLDEANDFILEESPTGIIVRDIRRGRIKYEISTTGLNIERINYMKYASCKGYILCLVNTDDVNYALFFNRAGKVLWKQGFIDRFFLTCEINEEWKSFIIQTSDYIYCYKMAKLEEEG